MRSDFQARVDARLDAYLKTHGAPEAPWVRFPEIQAMSIGWRMGGGESWLDLWRAYMRRLGSGEARFAYLVDQPTAPRDWQSGLVGAVFDGPPEDLTEQQQGELLARLEAAGIVGDDAAYPLWLAKCEGKQGVVAPWVGAVGPPREAVDACFSYDLRELAWWARWCRDHGEIGVWLAGQPPAEGAWRRVAASLVEGRPSATRSSSLDLVCELAATGQLAPPWVCGEPPWEDHGSYDDDAGPADKWGWWSFAVFDDAASWQRYLADWEPSPEAWRTELEEHLGWLP